MSSIFRFLLITVFALLFGACTEIKDELEIDKDDVDFDVNNRTLDVTKDRAQLIAYGFVQSTLKTLLNLPLFKFLDGTDLPPTALLVDPEYVYDCQYGGQAFYTFARPAGDELREDDRFTARYELCEEREGFVYDGSVSVKYTGFGGLNKVFGLNSTERCVNNQGAKFDEGYSVYENRDDEGELFWADAVRFERFGSGLEIQFLKQESASGNIQNVIIPNATKRVSGESIVILRSLVTDEDRSENGVDRYKLKENVYPSLDEGDRVYRLDGTTFSEAQCQGYERSLSLTASDISVVSADGVTYRMNGSSKAWQSSEKLVQFTQRLYDGDFGVSVTQGNETLRYGFDDNYDFSWGTDSVSDAYSFSVTGEMKFDDGGVAELQQSSVAYSQSLSSPPFAGVVRVLGQNEERVNIRFDSETVTLGIDYDGDNNGNGESDTDAVVDVYWVDLLSQNFQEL